jgi:hypothetical protein
MQVRQQVLRVLRLKVDGWHHAMALENGNAHTIVVGWSTAGQIFPLEDAEHRRTVQGVGVTIVVTLRTACLKHRVAARLLGVQLAQRCGWWRVGLAPGEDRVEDQKRAEREPGLARSFHQIHCGSFSSVLLRAPFEDLFRKKVLHLGLVA